MKKILTTILLFLFLLTFTINIVGFNYFIHKYEFKKLNVYSEFQDKSVVDKQSLNIIKNIYFNTNPDSNFLSETEIIHIKDVRNLVLLSLTILVISLALLIFILLKNKSKIKSLLFTSSFINIIIFIIIALPFFINFSSSFTVFHEIFYTNDYWLISPGSDIIKIYPEKFFVDMGSYILIANLIISLIILMFSRIKLNHSYRIYQKFLHQK